MRWVRAQLKVGWFLIPVHVMPDSEALGYSDPGCGWAEGSIPRAGSVQSPKECKLLRCQCFSSPPSNFVINVLACCQLTSKTVLAAKGFSTPSVFPFLSCLSSLQWGEYLHSSHLPLRSTNCYCGSWPPPASEAVIFGLAILL